MPGAVRAAAQREVHAPLEETIKNRLGQVAIMHYIALPLDIPRDRAGSFTPQLDPKGVRRLSGFDQQVLSLYARADRARVADASRRVLPGAGLARCHQCGHGRGTARAPGMAAAPLGAGLLAVAFDALRVKIRDEGLVQHKAVYLALGLTVQVHPNSRSP